ncbi:hypothetical protein [Neobacillus ginsengisoli]|uniref:Uncharacterized protein n=1 Tax=Neobacillus ginsengisoli TaxID=904295 RepID=A0ABT9Y2X6_9BACI|nr:hypothetical protein [Neobacillus ginsengisoli]MDQ0202177.1 hypothetical protein [Neobacillus ginsengisoli]
MKESELVETWVKRIQLSKNKEYDIKRVLQEIDVLVDSISKEPITIEVKKRLLEKLYQELALPPRLIDGRLLLNEQFDNKYYLDLIKNALEILNRTSK